MGSSIINKDQDKRERLIFETIRDISSDGFLVVDENGIILTINPAYCHFLGVKQVDFLGRPVTELIANSKLPNILKTGVQEVNVVDRIILPSEKGEKVEKYVLATRTLVRNEGKVVAAVGQVRFSKETVDLASKFQLVDEELQFYKEELKRITNENYSFKSIVGSSSTLKDVVEVARKAAKSDFHILITGETGTGKEVFAQVIHYHSKRWSKPFIKVNCAAIPANLLESELFGYEEGAFTGSRKGGKKGKFELANGGTIFLDEIGDMPIAMQAKILRVLQEQEIEKLGSEKTIPISVRVIAATNQNLYEEVKKKNFRDDLYYRLNVIPLHLPPLRDRIEDIPILAQYFLDELNQRYGSNVTMRETEKGLLQKHSWPGNIRELRNTVERMYCLSDDADMMSTQIPGVRVAPIKEDRKRTLTRPLSAYLEEIERQIILDTLEEEDYNIRKSAQRLSVHRGTLYNRIEKLHIPIRRSR